jgi:hypothetical protein
MRVPDPGPGTRNSLDAAGACVSSLLPSAQRRGRHCCRRVIPKGGSAAINVCYGLTYPAVRFVVKGDGAPATVHVRVNSRSLPGILSILDGGTFTAGTTWAPSPKLSTLFSALAAPLGAKSMQLQFTVESGSASIDELFVDPFLSKS